MLYDSIDGLDKKISKLIMGNDNQIYFDEAAKLWDHWIEVGGNAFDNAHIYGQGSMEKLLGDWHRKRDNLKDLVIIAKGAHTPNCDPKSITSQLTESLDRLQTETADIYIMHRDNAEIPVDELASAKLFFENNITAVISTSIMQNMDNNAVIEGENGKIIVDDPWMPGRDGGCLLYTSDAADD